MIMGKLTDLCQEKLFKRWKTRWTVNLDSDHLNVRVDLVTDHVLDSHKCASQ
jgi:hypothetical protein